MGCGGRGWWLARRVLWEGSLSKRNLLSLPHDYSSFQVMLLWISEGSRDKRGLCLCVPFAASHLGHLIGHCDKKILAQMGHLSAPARFFLWRPINGYLPWELSGTSMFSLSLNPLAVGRNGGGGLLPSFSAHEFFRDTWLTSVENWILTVQGLCLDPAMLF